MKRRAEGKAVPYVAGRSEGKLGGSDWFWAQIS